MEDKIKEIIEKVRPYIKMHGGDVVFVGIKDNDVVLRVFGACKDCPLSDLTYNKMIGGLLKKEIPEIKKVIII